MKGLHVAHLYAGGSIQGDVVCEMLDTTAPDILGRTSLLTRPTMTKAVKYRTICHCRAHYKH